MNCQDHPQDDCDPFDGLIAFFITLALVVSGIAGAVVGFVFGVFIAKLI